MKMPMKPERYVRDRNGIIWGVVRDGGMVTTADYTGAFSAGIDWLEQNHGPLEEVRAGGEEGQPRTTG